jgi:hypothetical protein|tara:strand:- start:4035 stop:4949 length:915 start_codon:yes stop_codon:yes gene_type:complete
MATTPTTPPVGSSASSTLSEYVGPYVTELLGKTQAVADQPYSVYQGPMTAGESNLQSNVFKGLGELSFPSQLGQTFSSTGAYQPPAMTPGAYAPGAIGTGAGAPMGGGIGSLGGGGNQATGTTPPPLGMASQYMNPYLQSVLQPQLEELRRQSQINMQPGLAKMTQSGGYGGGRQAIMESEANRNLLQEQNKAIGTGYSSAYDKAMGQFNTEQGQAKTLADMMSGAGATQRGIEQEGITADYNEFLAQRDYPEKQLKLMQSMLQGLPISTVSNQPASQSGIGQLSSTIGGLGNLMNALKQFNLT